MWTMSSYVLSIKVSLTDQGRAEGWLRLASTYMFSSTELQSEGCSEGAGQSIGKFVVCNVVKNTLWS